MAEKNIKTRIKHKHDTPANWLKASRFIPLAGELIIYDGEGATANTPAIPARLKVGDGITTVANLPFVSIGEEAVETLQASILATNTKLLEKESVTNKVSDNLNTLANTLALTDDQYPTAKAVVKTLNSYATTEYVDTITEAITEQLQWQAW